jgi:hypothetical protein
MSYKFQKRNEKKKHKHLLIVRIKQKKKKQIKLTSQLLIEQKQGGRRR